MQWPLDQIIAQQIGRYYLLDNFGSFLRPLTSGWLSRCWRHIRWIGNEVRDVNLTSCVYRLMVLNFLCKIDYLSLFTDYYENLYHWMRCNCSFNTDNNKNYWIVTYLGYKLSLDAWILGEKWECWELNKIITTAIAGLWGCL